MQTLTLPPSVMPYPSECWYWPVLDEYRDADGRTLVECDLAWMAKCRPDYVDQYRRERGWQWSPKPAAHVAHMIQVLSAFFNPVEPMTYLEFGSCWGTTLASVLSAFPRAHAIGLEPNPYRYDVTRFMLDRTGVAGRASLRCCAVQEADVAPNSVDVVFMDTNHTEEDYDYILHVLGSGWLRRHWLFVGDDPEHTGTKVARERFIERFAGTYHIITRPDLNLWWFRGA